MAVELSQERKGTASRVLEGTLQRVNYQRRELSVVAEGQIWHFEAGPDCRYCFDGQPVILRCFHPLDRVRVEFRPGYPAHQLQALSGAGGK